MFDYHMHTTVSFDGIGTAEEMVEAAVKAGLREICFTDHFDYHNNPEIPAGRFSPVDYAAAYDSLFHPRLIIRRGVEFGLTVWNQKELSKLLQTRPFDFVIGSVHYVGGYDPYEKGYWEEKTVKEAFSLYLEETLACVKAHRDYDVLGHLTYVCKSPNNPTHEPVLYENFQEITDEILRELVRNGKGMEINTSGVDRVGDFLPSAPFLRRFRELGGEIVTLGSDAHAPDRVGQYATEALDILREIFGYVCTFEGRKPIFHKL
ncbi:MAG: histidinol-phosphatase HisJ family protein [Clostridia bacterium]|nr:histidinol-phosphatase HisJ family protein [Clostridia bacterium]